MSINLVKGQRVNIGLNHVVVGLGWDPAESGEDFDLDASAFMLDARGKIPRDRFFVFYNNQISEDNAVRSSGDDRTGGNSDGGDDESLDVWLNNVSPQIQQIIFVVTIYEAVKRNQNFGQVHNSYIRIVDVDSNQELARYDLDQQLSGYNCMEMGRLYRDQGEWKFEALGEPSFCNGNTGLEDLLQKYS